MLSSAQVRQQFIDFFAQRAGHNYVPSSPVVPHDDPTLLFTNAGMNQYKPIFLGQVRPGSPFEGLKRAVNSQKCIRAGGKHNDLDDVGKDTYHHTFFEMLGNWSFGDYFKTEAIQWAWELLTDLWGVDPERLYATYFEGDKALGLDPDREAYDLWCKYLPAERILPGNTKDNFWEMGDTGPCGPCSEIHFDGRSDEERASVPGFQLVNRESPDVIEIWNLVFIQFNRLGKTELEPLPAKHVDTGMGFERIVRVLQGKTSNYDTDVFTPLFARIREVCNAPAYTGSLTEPVDIAYRVLADHARTLTFAITDGTEPSNDGRGYVLRRILRRAVRYGRQTLGVDGAFLHELVPTVVESMGDAFPEIKGKADHVIAIIKDEEEAFGRTLNQGVMHFEQSVTGAARSIKPYTSQLAEVIEPIRVDVNRRILELNTAVNKSLNVLREPIERINTAVNTFLETNRSTIDAIVQNLPQISEALRNLSEELEHLKVSIKQIPDLQAREQAMLVFEHFPATEFYSIWNEMESHEVVSAKDAFRLHDTYGFPIDLTQLMAEERGLTVDVEGFYRLMEEARERSRAGTSRESAGLALTPRAVSSLRSLNIKPTDDSFKFDPKKMRARVCAIWNGTDFDENISAANTRPDTRFVVILDKTVFYAEMGGQVADTGKFRVIKGTKTGTEFLVESVGNTGGYIVHAGCLPKGELRVGDEVELRLDEPRRLAIASNHTATHLLNLALRETLGNNIDQRGSLVAPDRLRFDYSHGHAMSLDEAMSVQKGVRDSIDRDLGVYCQEAPLETSQAINGLRAVFGETYPDPVRVVSVGPSVDDLLATPENPEWMSTSIEFCGGTHLVSTGKCRAFVLLSEEAVSKGVRRVIGVTGEAAEQAIAESARVRSRIEGAATLDDKHLVDEVKEIERELERAVLPLADRAVLREFAKPLHDRAKQAHKAAAGDVRQGAVESAKQLSQTDGVPVVLGKIPSGSDRQALLAAMDTARAHHSECAIMLLSTDEAEGKVTIAAAVPDHLIAKGLKAGDWVRAVSTVVGGKGGGRPDAAQGGGTDPSKVDDAIAEAIQFAESQVG